MNILKLSKTEKRNIAEFYLNKLFGKDYLNFFKTHSNVVAAYGKQVPLPGTTYQNLIDLDIIFKDQNINKYLCYYLKTKYKYK